MVGLSVVLEGQKGGISEKTTHQVINKTMMLSSINKHYYSPSSAVLSLKNSHQYSRPFQEPTTFLDQCFLCRKKLLPEKDIYMYKGDRAFCSVECRCKQIFMDEQLEEAFQKQNCSLAAMRPTNTAPSSSAAEASHHQKGSRNRPGAFAY